MTLLTETEEKSNIVPYNVLINDFYTFHYDVLTHRNNISWFYRSRKKAVLRSTCINLTNHILPHSSEVFKQGDSHHTRKGIIKSSGTTVTYGWQKCKYNEEARMWKNLYNIDVLKCAYSDIFK